MEQDDIQDLIHDLEANVIRLQRAKLDDEEEYGLGRITLAVLRSRIEEHDKNIEGTRKKIQEIKASNEFAVLERSCKEAGLTSNIKQSFEWCPVLNAMFAISKYPVTNLQFNLFLENGYTNPNIWKTLRTRYDRPGHPHWDMLNHPRENVNWYEAMAFCQWVGTVLKIDITLPTEREWIQAASNSSRQDFPWGNDYVLGYANVNEAYSIENGVYLRKTTPVGIYPLGGATCGAADMAGNVWEWTQTPTGNNRYILKGGSWDDDIQSAKIKSRLELAPDQRSHKVGFRIVCPINQLMSVGR